MDEPKPSARRRPSKFMDIVPGNKTVPSASGRPIIVTNHPEQADPMLNPAPPEPLKAVTVKPVVVKEAPPAEPDASLTPDEPVKEQPKPVEPEVAKPVPAPEPVLATVPAPAPAPTPTPVSAPEPEPVKPTKPAANPEAPALLFAKKLHDEDLMKDMPLDLPDGKEKDNKPPAAVVVHHSYSSKTMRNAITIFLILVILAVIVDLLLDLHYISYNIQHTNFFGP